MRQLITELLERIVAAVHAERATLTRIDGDSVVIEGCYDVTARIAELGQRWPISAPEFLQMLADRQPLVQRYDLANLASPLREQLADVRHTVTIPLVLQGDVFGAIAVSRREDRAFAPHDVEVLGDLGRIAMIALHNSLLQAGSRAKVVDLQSSEERFRFLVDSVKDYAIFMLDPDGYVTSWNQGAQRIKGYRAEEIIGRHFSTFYPAEDLARGEPQKGLLMAEQEGRFEAEGWRRRKDGSRFWASVVITALRDEGGRLRGFAKVTRDITERKRLQDQFLESERREMARLQEHAQRMANLDQTKSQFLNLASHELRTPVSLIRGYAALFEEGELGQLTENGKHAIAVLSDQARKLHLLIGQMLDVARMEQGALETTKQLLDLRDVVTDAVAAVRGVSVQNHQVSARAPATAVLVVADRRQLQIILGNLLDNAIKYSPDGGEVVCQVDLEPPWAAVRIRDRGLGIEPDQLDQLFRPFGRIPSGRTAPILGAGLGLYLSQTYARLQGGDISVESKLGQGSVFTVRLPVATGPESFRLTDVVSSVDAVPRYSAGHPGALGSGFVADPAGQDLS